MKTYSGTEILVYQHRHQFYNLSYVLTAEDLCLIQMETKKNLIEVIRLLASFVEETHLCLSVEKDGRIKVYDILIDADIAEDVQCYMFRSSYAIIVEVQCYIGELEINKKDLDAIKRLLAFS